MFKNFAHFLASAAQKLVQIGGVVKSDIIKAAGAEPQIAAAVSKAEGVAEAIAANVDPAAVTVLRGAMHVFGVAGQALLSVGEAATQNGMSISLDADAVAALKAALLALGGKG